MACKYKIGNQEFETKEDLKKFISQRNNISDNMLDAIGIKPIARISSHQYSTDQWVGMAMRRAMRMAAQEGFDRIAWVTGEQSADRYDLSRQVDNIEWANVSTTGDAVVTINLPNKVLKYTVDRSSGNIKHTLLGEDYTGKLLGDVVGKDLSEKILGEKFGELEGEGLKVGGEGMKTFYNSIVPKVVKKEARRFDKKANIDVVDFRGKTTVRNAETISEMIDNLEAIKNRTESQNKDLQELLEVQKATEKDASTSIQKQLSIKITPKMKENLSQGVPLFQKQLEKNGIKVIPNGFTINNEVYLNKDTMNGTTPIHEFSHLYNSWLKQNRPEVYKKGLDLVKAELGKTNSEIQDVIDYVKETQPTLKGEALNEEILTELVGRRGLEKITDQKQSGIIEWLKEAWQSIKDMLGISQMSTEEVLNLDLQSYADAMAVDLLRGRNIESKTYKQFLSLPNITQKEALDMYKNLFKEGNYDWQNTNTLNC